METRNKRAELIHILERHQKDYDARGISAKEIPAFIKKAIDQNMPTENTQNKHGKAVILKIDGKQYKIAIGMNGYIVTAYPS